MTSKHPPRKIANYPIPGDPKGGALLIFGDENAKNMALMSAGFPDGPEIFLPFASRLAKETDTLVGVTCLPGYDDREDKPWTEHKRDKKDGYSFDEMAICIREAAKALRSESSCPSKPKFTGIFHDWGTCPGAMWSNRAIAEGSDNAPDELVYFDVLMPPHPQTLNIPAEEKKSMYQVFCGSFYQCVFVCAFGIQRYVSNALAIMCLVLGIIPIAVLPIGPTLKIDDAIHQQRSPPLSLSRVIFMCYPYFHMTSVSVKKLLKYELDDDFTLPQDLAKVPVLYMYGTEKRAAFHVNASVKILEREHKENKSKSNAIAVDGAGHYLYIQKPDLCFDCVTSFMQKDKVK